MLKLRLKIPPVAQGIIALIFIWLLNRHMPVLHIDFAFKGILSAMLICIGTLIGFLAVAAFIKIRTTVDPRYPEKTSKLVVIGIYRYSRNPMYLAIVLVLLGISMYLGGISSLMVLVLFVIYINLFQIIPEEKILENKFGERYSKYTDNVRRWI